MSAHEPLDYHRVFTLPQFTIRDLLWLTTFACVIAAAIGRDRLLTAKVNASHDKIFALDHSARQLYDNWIKEIAHRDAYKNALIDLEQIENKRESELIELRRQKAALDWFWSGKDDSEYDGPIYPIQRNPYEEEKGPLKADRSSWDVYERIHDHMSAFHGTVQADTATEALVAAKKKYGDKITHVAAYERQGFVAPLSDDDLGCYRQPTYGKR